MKGVIKKIFKDHLEDYIASGKSKELRERPYLIKWLKHMIYCGTLWLGVFEFICGCGMHKVYIPIPCHTKVCLVCGWVYRLKQICCILHKALNCNYYFITFTVPHSLQFIFIDNRKAYITAFNQAITETFLEYLKVRKIDVLPGTIAVPHTFGSMLQLHVHFHVLVTCGGVDKVSGQWIDIKHYPIDFLKQAFRAKFVAILRKLHKQGNLKFADKSMNSYKNFNKIVQTAFAFKKAWYTHISCKFQYKKEKWNIKCGDVIDTLVYALRYLNRLPISEYNIIGYDGKFVTWLPKKNRLEDESFWKANKRMRTPVYEFMEKLLVHVPSKNERTFYYSGLYAPAYKSTLYAKAKEHFNNKCIIPSFKKGDHPEILHWSDLRKFYGKDILTSRPVDPSICPHCGGKIKFVQKLTFNEAMCKSHFVQNNQIVPIHDSG